ncbi:unnamed protein product, partial [Prorocentrum cordatum]
MLWGLFQVLRPEAAVTVLLTTVGHVLTAGRVPIAFLIAATLGFPVPVMAFSALRMGGGRMLYGLGALAAILRGAHTTLGVCRLLSVTVAAAGCPSMGPEACLPVLAAACWPAFPEAAGAPAPPRPRAEPRPLAQGANVAKWHIDAKRTRAFCTCFASSCKGPITRGDLRVRSAANTVNPRWYHASCVKGGLGPQGDLEGFVDLQQEDQAKAQKFCDHPGGVSRAQYVETEVPMERFDELPE